MALNSRALVSIKSSHLSVFCCYLKKNFLQNGSSASQMSYRFQSNRMKDGKEGKIPRDPATFFFDPEVQTRLLDVNMQKISTVFRSRKEGDPVTDPEIKFLTQDQLEMEQEKALDKARYYLQLPPVLLPRKEEVVILSKDPALQGLEESKLIVTDITFGVPHRDRVVAVREPDGILRHATRDEHRRMVQAYFPNAGRTYETPQFFSPENLKSLLERSEFVFVLDRACSQFEPDDAEYVDVTSKTYDYINDNGKYDDLIGTRHYGSMAFYLIFNGKFDKLLRHCISSFRIRDAVAFVRVFYVTRPDLKVLKEPTSPEDTDYLKEYIKSHSNEKPELSKILNAYLELNIPADTEDAMSELKGLKN